MGMPSMPELLVILAIVVLLFGAKKIPDLAKGIGKGIKDFKKAVRDDEEETTQQTKELKEASKNENITKNTTDQKIEDTKKA